MGIPAQLSSGISGSNKAYKSRDLANGLISGTFAAVGPSAALSVWGPMNLAVWGELADQMTTAAGSTSVTAASGTSVANGDTVASANLPPGATVLSGGGGTSLVVAMPPVFFPALANGIRSGSPLIRMGGLPVSLATLVGATILNSDFFAAGTTILSADATTRTLTASANATASMDTGASLSLVEFAPTGNYITATGADAAAFTMGPATPINLTLQLERSFDGGRRWIACNLGGDGTLAQWALTKPLSVTFGDPEAGMLYRLNALAYTGVTNTTVRYRLSTTGQGSTSLSVPAIS